MGDRDAPHDERLDTSLYRGLFDHGLVEVHVWRVVRDDAGEVVDWYLVDANPRALASWRKARHEVVGFNTETIFRTRLALDSFMPIVREVMRTGEPCEWEVSFPATDQVMRMVTYPVGECFVSTGFDVSDERARQQALADALDALQQAVRDGGVGLWDWDLESGRCHFSDEYWRQLGSERADAERVATIDALCERCHPDDRESVSETLTRCTESLGSEFRAEYRMRHDDGSYRWMRSHASVSRDADGNPTRLRGSHIDVTERKRLEAQVNKAQTFEAVGTLAAGVAHDFNNLLTAVTGNLTLLRDDATPARERAEILDDIEHATLRARDLTSQLLAFATGGTPIRKSTAIGALVVECARFMTRGSAVECAFLVDDDLPNVEADVGQLSQVINNLVINAREAMPSGGVVTVRATTRVIAPETGHGLESGDYVEVSVRDEGPGIDGEAMARLFEPFYSTKADGSGLGLSTSRSIVDAHGGRLTVESEPGRGATFRFVLPAVVSEAPVRDALEPPRRGSGRVLVMDDHQDVRRLYRRLLERLGYQCDTVATGQEAIDCYQHAIDTHRPFIAVILDLTVPGGRGGVQVLTELRAIDPDVKALVSSGYADHDVLANYETHGFSGCLVKPVRVSAFARELARVVDR